ncbi:hypothetical protein BDZ94DRAFT_623381 [Collybia nuda]|uniref:Uncharacterized protein n=1 Tax=Collybia nuda TaxID=64659 RepID=A0A9P6CEV1_9AGAR|nr:hypothetical protein BDZ94DRAFT_623381 [Collybia nuda]
MNRYIESSSKDYLMNNTTNKSGEDSRDLDFIYTPGIEPRSIKASSSRYSISPKPEYTLEPEEENMILSRQIIEDFILRHSSPTPSSGEQLNTDSGSTPTLYTSPCPSTSISPQTSRAQLTITERNHILVSDVRTKEVQLDEVKCGKCKEWIKVSLTSIRGWEVHVNTCFNVNHLTALQIARRIELARDIRVTSFGPRHVECAFCCSRVTLKGAEDYVLKSWKLHIAHWS